jgi:isoleucyl-tRNA synthetase
MKKARNFALTQVEKQEKQFKNLALMADFDNKYLTLDPAYEAGEISVFHKMLNNGLAYQDLKPIH